MLRRDHKIRWRKPARGAGLRGSYAAIPQLMELFSNSPDCCPMGTAVGGKVSYTEVILLPKKGL